MPEIPEFVKARRRRYLAEQAEREAMRRRGEARAELARLEAGAWLSLAQLSSAIGVERRYLAGHLAELTTRRRRASRGRHPVRVEVRADEKLEALCRRRFVRVQIGDRPPTL